jgi:spore coat protein CotF
MSDCHSEINEFDISGIEAMLAGTLCLMSAYSHHQAHNALCINATQSLMGQKIISNLTCLQCQNNLSPEFRRVLSQVCDSWRQHGLSQPKNEAQAPSELNRALWHGHPDRVQ